MPGFNLNQEEDMAAEEAVQNRAQAPVAIASVLLVVKEFLMKEAYLVRPLNVLNVVT
jgi:hypothetical protein